MMRLIAGALICLLLISCKSKVNNATSSSDDSTSRDLMQAPKDQAITRIAFGSCNREDKPQTYWKEIAAQNPNLWIWLGDNIYGDTEDMTVLKAKYDQQKNNASYATFREQVPIIGIWDDHDYGVNDGDKSYPGKVASQKLALDFLDVPQDHPSRKQAGLYQSYAYGPKGKQVKVILLDTRYFRDALKKDASSRSRYLPNEKGDVLGDAQWAWLESELKNSEAQVHLIGTSIQAIPEEHRFEKWANFPKARKRLFDLIEQEQVSHPIILSGDRHLAEVSKLERTDLAHPIYEITSSGLTHSYEKADEPNKHRISQLIGLKNYGLLEFDWSKDEPRINFSLRKVKGGTHFSLDLSK